MGLRREMNNFTYEFTNTSTPLEIYEWDNVWWEHAGTEGVPRVLYIGDSISCATRRVATETAGRTVFFDGFGTSKALDNPYFSDSVRMFAAQQGERQVILFNNGLHGWHLEDEGAYAQAYEKMILFLREEFTAVPLLLLLTTHVADSARDARVQARNRAVLELAEKYDLPVVDLYSVTKENAHLLSPDGVHFLPEGYKLLAGELVRRVRELIL